MDSWLVCPFLFPFLPSEKKTKREREREKDVRAIPVGFSNSQPICLLDHLHPGHTRRYRGPGGAAVSRAEVTSSRGGSDACIDKLDEH